MKPSPDDAAKRRGVASRLYKIDQELGRLVFDHGDVLTKGEFGLIGTARMACEEASIYLKDDPVTPMGRV